LQEIPEQVKDERNAGRVIGGRRSVEESARQTAFRPEPVQPKPVASVDFGDGDRVRHQKFGIGTVIACRGSGTDVLVTVAFDQAGLKTLSMQYTALERA
jgi:hypothetical protein